MEQAERRPTWFGGGGGGDDGVGFVAGGVTPLAPGAATGTLSANTCCEEQETASPFLMVTLLEMKVDWQMLLLLTSLQHNKL